MKNKTNETKNNVTIVGVNNINTTKKEKYDKRMRQYRENVAKRKPSKGEKISITIKKILNKMLSSQMKMPILDDKILTSNIDRCHNAVFPFNAELYTGGVYTKNKNIPLPKNLTKDEMYIICSRYTTPKITHLDMIKGLIRYKMALFDKYLGKLMHDNPETIKQLKAAGLWKDYNTMHEEKLAELNKFYNITPDKMKVINKPSTKFKVVITGSTGVTLKNGTTTFHYRIWFQKNNINDKETAINIMNNQRSLYIKLHGKDDCICRIYEGSDSMEWETKPELKVAA